MKTLNWDKYRRIQCNIDKAVCNQAVVQLLEGYYSQLHTELVATDEDEGIFNDTFLKLTYKFNPEEPFTDSFRYYFKLLKGAYKRDSRSCYCMPLDEAKIKE